MLYRVSLTGKQDRFSVPQLGYLGYHQLTLNKSSRSNWPFERQSSPLPDEKVEVLDAKEDPLLANEVKIQSKSWLRLRLLG